VRLPRDFTRRLLFCLGSLLAVRALATPVDFNLPAQSAASALLAFSQQAHVEVLYSYDDLKAVSVGALTGRYEPEAALKLLLQNTGFAARRNLRGKYVVTRATRPTGSIEGRILHQTGEPARGINVALATTRLRALTDESGAFVFPAVPPGNYRLVAGAIGYQLLEQPGVVVEAGHPRDVITNPQHERTKAFLSKVL
jgi:hypothetical protein